jgi:hypothetical protein
LNKCPLVDQDRDCAKSQMFDSGNPAMPADLIERV